MSRTDSVARSFRSLSSPSNPNRSGDHDIVDAIRRQVGPQAFRMLGSTIFVSDGPSLTFDVKSSPRWNRVRIALDPDDTYTVQFFKVGRAPACKVTMGEPHAGVYVDMLHDLIEAETGLYVRLAARPRGE